MPERIGRVEGEGAEDAALAEHVEARRLRVVQEEQAREEEAIRLTRVLQQGQLEQERAARQELVEAARTLSRKVDQFG